MAGAKSASISKRRRHLALIVSIFAFPGAGGLQWLLSQVKGPSEESIAEGRLPRTAKHSPETGGGEKMKRDMSKRYRCVVRSQSTSRTSYRR